MSTKRLTIKGITPGPGRVIIRPWTGREQDAVKDEGGILYRPTARATAQPKGQVVEIDQNGYTEGGRECPTAAKVGDWVIIGANTQTPIVVDGLELWETYQSNIKAVIAVEITDDDQEGGTDDGQQEEQQQKRPQK